MELPEEIYEALCEKGKFVHKKIKDIWQQPSAFIL